MHNPDEAAEEYLEAMYRLKENGVPISIAKLSSMLKVSAPSASEMVRKLQSRHLVSHGAYGKIELCTKGEEIGWRMLRKHRLVEHFLSFLGVRKGLHEQACRLEHAVSDQLEKKMADMADGKRCLADLDIGVAAKIVSIDSDAASAKRLSELGLTKGTTVVLSSKAPFHGPVEILVRDTRLALGRKLALRIRARLVK